MAGQILKDRELDEKLLQEGFVVIPFLNHSEISALIEFFHASHNTDQKGLYASAHVPDPEFRRRVREGMRPHFERAISENLADVNPLGGSYIIKAPGEEGTLYPHQDWNIVDEKQFRSFNIWVPLVDTTAENGAVGVISASHNKWETYRGANIDCAFRNIYDEIWDKLELLEMRAGAALIYDHRLIHASRANTSDALRVAAVFGFIPQAAEMKYYYREEDHIAEYDCNPEFYIEENPGQGPGSLKKLRDIAYDFPEIDASSFRANLGYPPKEFLPEKNGILARIKSFFN